MATWDIAREAFDCAGGEHVVGQGEAYRVSKLPRRIGHCEACALRLFDEQAPADLRASDFIHRLRDAIANQAPRREPSSFTGFDRSSIGAQLRANITHPKPAAKPTATSVAPGRQPSIDPRGQRQKRHGVADAMRDSFDTDYRRRSSGERD